MRDKKGDGIGEMIETIPFFVMATLIAFVVFTASSVYSYNVNVRDSEAMMLGRDMVDCLSPQGILDLDKIGEDDRERVTYYCWIFDSGRFYVGIDVFNSSGEKIASLYEGDSGALWVRDLFRLADNVVSSDESVEKIMEYKPGYFVYEYPVFVIDGGKKFKGSVKMEVLVNNDK